MCVLYRETDATTSLACSNIKSQIQNVKPHLCGMKTAYGFILFYFLANLNGYSFEIMIPMRLLPSERVSEPGRSFIAWSKSIELVLAALQWIWYFHMIAFRLWTKLEMSKEISCPVFDIFFSKAVRRVSERCTIPSQWHGKVPFFTIW